MTSPDMGYGVTATKKFGGAVIRNRQAPILALIWDIFPEHALSGADHVLIARSDALTLTITACIPICKGSRQGA